MVLETSMSGLCTAETLLSRLPSVGPARRGHQRHRSGVRLVDRGANVAQDATKPERPERGIGAADAEGDVQSFPNPTSFTPRH
jgi:hypothetical protein